MKNSLLLLFCVLCVNVMFAQKAKFKSVRSKVQKIKLPTNYVSPEDRTYAIYTKGIYSENVGDPTQGIYGWTYDENSPKIEAMVSIYGFRIDPAKRSSSKKTKKDKDGNVTETWTEYVYTGSATGRGTLYTYGQSETFKYERRNSKSKKKEEEKKKAEKEEAAANPFLSAEDASDDEGESNEGEDSGLDGTAMPLAERRSLDISTTVKSRSHRSITAAYKDYRENQISKLYDFRDGYPERVYNSAINTLNSQYGYSPTNFTVFLREMKSEKHPEFEMWNNAEKAAVTLFKGFRYNKSISDYQKKFDPIIAYFNSQVENIADSDKKGKTLKRAAFNNLIQIMYYLDRYEQVIALCEAQKESKMLGKSAEKMLRRANRQVALMAFHKVKTCHFEEMAEIDMDDIVSDEEEIEDEEGR